MDFLKSKFNELLLALLFLILLAVLVFGAEKGLAVVVAFAVDNDKLIIGSLLTVLTTLIAAKKSGGPPVILDGSSTAAVNTGEPPSAGEQKSAE